MNVRILEDEDWRDHQRWRSECAKQRQLWKNIGERRQNGNLCYLRIMNTNSKINYNTLVGNTFKAVIHF